MSATPTAVGIGRGWLRRSLGALQLKTARRVALVSGAAAVVCTTVLIGDHAVGVWRGAGQTARIVELEGQTKGDPEVAARLHEERKRHTDESLARESRGHVLAWLLLVSGGVFVAAGRWVKALEPRPVPSLDSLVAVRFAVPVRGETRARREGAGSTEGARGEGDGNVAPEAEDRVFLDQLVGRFGRDREAAIPILQAIQTHYRYLPDEVLRRVCEKTDITPAQIAGTSSFYSQFRRSPVGRHVVKVCHGTACHVAGAEQITEELRRHLEIPAGQDTDDQRLFTLDKVACVGCCSLAPVMMIEEDTAGHLTPATARQALDTVAKRT